MVCCDTSTSADGVSVADVERPLQVTVSFPHLDLLPGEYVLGVGVYEADRRFAFDYHWHAYRFGVVGLTSDHGVFRPRHVWSFDGE